MKGSNLISDPDVIKYVDAGLYAAKQAEVIIRDMQEKRDKSVYNDMTVDQIRDLLTPLNWEELEKRALDSEG